MKSHTIGIVGLGQIGGSMAAALKESGRRLAVCGFDLKSDLLAAAHARGYVDVVASDSTELVGKCSVIIISLPMGEIFTFLADHAETLKDKELVIDTGSLKAQVVSLAEDHKMTNFVGGHPLAGTEKRGTDAWTPELFRDENYFLTPTVHTSPESYGLARTLVSWLGARVVEIGGEQHDRIFATTSNIPHLFAFLLRHKFEQLCALDEKVARFVCPSFYGATRVAQSDPEMVFQMLWHNRDRLGETLDELIDKLEKCKRDLAEADEASFRNYFQKNMTGSNNG